MAKTDGVARIIALAALGKNGGSSTGGTTNYLELANKPKINNVELTGNKTLEDLGINIPDLENYYTKDIVNEALSKKQDTLIAGKNIIINGEVINAADDVIPTYILQTNIRPKYDESVEFTDVYDDLGKIINDNPGKTVHLCLYIPTNGIYITLAYYGTMVCPDIRTSTAISASYPSFMTMNQNKARIILSLELNIDKTVTPHKAVVKKFSCVEGPTEYAVTEDISNVENRTMEMVMMMLEDSNNNFLAKTNTTEFVPTGDYNPATKKYVDDSKNYVGEYKFIILDDIYSLSKEYFDSVLLPAVKSVGWEKVVVILSHSIGYNAMGLYMFHQKIESTDEDGNAIQTIIFETIHPNIWEQYKSYYTSGSMLIEPTITQIVLTITNDEFANATFNYKRSGSGPRIDLLPIAEDAKNAPKVFIPTYDAEPATKKYVDDNVKTYTAGENIIISEDNVISANISGGIDSNAVYTYYAPYSDDDWFTEENVANILQTVKDKGYSNFELCTLNGNHYALRQGGNLQNLTTEGENYQLEYLQNDLKNYVYYFFVARLNEGGKIVVDGLGTQTYTAQEMVETYLPETLQKISGYDSSASHLILQSNNGIFEWDSSLDGGIFGDSYTDPAYYTEKQVDKIVTDTVNEALGGRY